MSTPQTRILLLTGNGKGKTTAALGMALRALGHDMRVALVHFVKAAGCTGETRILEKLPGISVEFCGLGFVRDCDATQMAAHRQAAAAGLELARKHLLSPTLEMVILDEICGAIDLALLDTHSVADAIRAARPGMIIVLTGRNAPPELLALADTISCIECLKHGLDTGHSARPGVEF